MKMVVMTALLIVAVSGAAQADVSRYSCFPSRAEDLAAGILLREGDNLNTLDLYSGEGAQELAAIRADVELIFDGYMSEQAKGGNIFAKAPLLSKSMKLSLREPEAAQVRSQCLATPSGVDLTNGAVGLAALDALNQEYAAIHVDAMNRASTGCDIAPENCSWFSLWFQRCPTSERANEIVLRYLSTSVVRAASFSTRLIVPPPGGRYPPPGPVTRQRHGDQSTYEFTYLWFDDPYDVSTPMRSRVFRFEVAGGIATLAGESGDVMEPWRREIVLRSGI